MTIEEIQSKLDKHGITRYQLAKDYGLDQGSLSKLFSGKIKLSGFAQAFFNLLFEKIDNEKRKQ
jgi:transcriptional regulator with XRE-family HTH domain